MVWDEETRRVFSTVALFVLNYPKVNHRQLNNACDPMTKTI